MSKKRFSYDHRLDIIKKFDTCYDDTVYCFDHVRLIYNKLNTDVIKENTDKLVISWSTITSGIHLALFLGAINIILVAHDCGKINDKLNFNKYHE